jgi:uncharacterized protein YndB with AHSA1/START domain
MQVEAETIIMRPCHEVFAYLSHAEHMPEYMPEFASVEQASRGAPGAGTRYRYTLAAGRADGTFEWTRFERDNRLEWRGPKVKAGPGSMQPAGWWEVSPCAEGTRVKLVMAPTPGGVFKVLSPFLAAGLRSGNQQTLERLKLALERGEGG